MDTRTGLFPTKHASKLASVGVIEVCLLFFERSGADSRAWESERLLGQRTTDKPPAHGRGAKHTRRGGPAEALVAFIVSKLIPLAVPDSLPEAVVHDLAEQCAAGSGRARERPSRREGDQPEMAPDAESPIGTKEEGARPARSVICVIPRPSDNRPGERCRRYRVSINAGASAAVW